MTNRLSNQEIRNLIEENTKKDVNNLHIVLESPHIPIIQNIVTSFSRHLKNEFAKVFEPLKYELIVNLQDYHKEDWTRLVLRKKSWQNSIIHPKSKICYCIEVSKKNISYICHGLMRIESGSKNIEEITNKLSEIGFGIKQNPDWYSWKDYPDSYGNWRDTNMLMNMAVECGYSKGEKTFEVTDFYVNEARKFMTAMEPIIDELLDVK